MSRAVMTVLFFPSLLLIALFERYIDTPHNRYMRSFFPLESSGEEDDPSVQNPEAAEEDAKNGRHISVVGFDEIVGKFPDPNDVSTAIWRDWRWRLTKEVNTEHGEHDLEADRGAAQEAGRDPAGTWEEQWQLVQGGVHVVSSRVGEGIDHFCSQLKRGKQTCDCD